MPGRRCFFLWLALGDNVWPSLRSGLAALTVLYRTGRFVGAEHQPAAIFCLIIASAIVLDDLVLRHRRWRTLVVVIVCIDFVGVNGATTALRFEQARKDSFLGQPLPRLPTSFGPEHQAVLDAPRHCEPAARQVEYQEFYHLPRFDWWGYSPARLARYEAERHGQRRILCGPGRLFLAEDSSSVEYRLISYTPGRVEIEIPGASKTRELVWADTDDGFWRFRIDGEPAPVRRGAASLRYFDVPAAADDVRIIMTYAGPLSRFLPSR